MATRPDQDMGDEDRADFTPDSPAGGGAAGLNPITVLTRRWPLVVVGVMVGLVLGALFHLQRQPKYESKSQVLVIKRSPNISKSSEIRDAMVDDLSTQVALLKSEHILANAGRKLNPAELNMPIPESDRGRAGLLAELLTVARTKDPSANPYMAPTGSGVLDLSLRATDPMAAKAMLEAVITTYQAELSLLFDESTRSRIKTLDDLIRALQAERERTLARRGEKSDELRRITEEELLSIRTRVSMQRDKELSLELEQVNVAKQLDLIAAAGVDRQKRVATMIQLAPVLKLGGPLGTINPNDPEIQIQLLTAKRQEKLQVLGRDHPDVISLDTQIKFYTELFKKLNPAAAAGEESDELWAIEQKLIQQKSTIDDQLVRIRAQIKSDREVIVSAGRLQDDILLMTEQAVNLDRDIKDRKKELLEIEATQSSGGYQAQVLTAAAPGRKVSPVATQSAALGVLVGLMIGGGLAFLAEFTDLGFKSPAEVRRRLGLPVIGHLPRLSIEEAPDDTAYPGLDAKLVVIHRPKSVEAEAYRGVRTQLYFSTQGHGHKLIQVTSPNPGDGKSTLTANVACSIAQSGKSVVLVDCDFRKPRVHKVFNLEKPDVGMASVVAGDAKLEDAIQKSAVPNLDILPCGPRPANPAELLTSPGFVEALKELQAKYDFVLLDTPPMLAVSDPAVVAPRVDGVVLVIRMSNKARPSAERARELLAGVGANIIGVCVNGVGGKSNDGYGGYGYSYGYGYNYQYRYQYQYDYEYAESYADEDEDEDTPAVPHGKG